MDNVAMYLPFIHLTLYTHMIGRSLFGCGTMFALSAYV